jgi:ribosomal protein S18 acetylase RimI-like enzyme
MSTYRLATRDEFELAVQWAADEGWNPGLRDTAVFWKTDPEGFVCAEENGEVIATGSIVSYGGNFGFMGFFIVRPDLRGRGIGREFWQWRRDRLRSRLKPGATIGMDGVFEMQPFYARGGFAFSHRNLRMEGVARSGENDAGLVELAQISFEQVMAYDRRHFGFDRAAFLRRWISPRGGRALGWVDNDELMGFGVIRPCRNGYKIGPLFADDDKKAEGLFGALTASVEGESIFLDVPENNPAAMALAKGHGLREVFGCARMYHGPAPDLPWERIFGVTSFELG